MKKLIPIFIFLFLVTSSNAQNWNPLHPTVRNYYTNVNGYLRATSLDSVAVHNNLLHYYPYRRLHFDQSGDYPNADTAGSWLGDVVIRKTDGTYLFPNYWNDTIKIKVFAPVGDTWTFYQGADSVYYVAEVTALDTMTVLGAVDSIRKIVLTAYANGNIIVADSFNNTELILSKEHGFYATMELYLFPFHAPGSSQTFSDYFLTNSLSSIFMAYWVQPALPGKNGCIFKLVNYSNPAPNEFIQWNVGDIYEYDACFTNSFTSYCSWPYMYKLDTVISKTVTTTGVEYILSGWRASPVYQQNFSSISYFTFRLGRDTVFFPNTGTYFEDFGVPEKLPEMYADPRATYYFIPAPIGSSQNDIYGKREFTYGLGGYGDMSLYARGMGPISAYWFSFADFETYGHEYISYSVRNGVESGTYFFPDTAKPIVTNYVTNINESSPITIYPNPASEQLTIETSLSRYKLSLINALGQVVYKKDGCDNKQVVDVRAFAAGIYQLRIETAGHEVINRKLIIQK